LAAERGPAGGLDDGPQAPAGAGRGRRAAVLYTCTNPDCAEQARVLKANLAEIGIDASDHVPRKLDAEALAWADVAVS